MSTKDMNWICIAIAGMFEVIWAVAMGLSDGFTKIQYDAVVVIGLLISMILLSKAIDGGLPVGTAYAVWTGIGAVGTLAVSVLMNVETVTALRVLFVFLIIVGIAGLQMSSETKNPE